MRANPKMRAERSAEQDTGHDLGHDAGHNRNQPSSQPSNQRRARSRLALCLAAMLFVGGSAQAFAQPTSPNAPPVDAFVSKPRIVVISDIGNEPDDQMSLVRLLLYSNELDIEGLIAATSTWQKTTTHPETMHELIRAYAQVRASLLRNADGWPLAAALDAVVQPGQPQYGMNAVGAGKASAGARELEAAIERNDPRPLWICLWGGANTLAQALLDLRQSLPADHLNALLAQVRVSSISDQDDAGPWIRREFPALDFIVTPSLANSTNYYQATWTGISGDRYYRNGEGADFSVVTNEWLDAHIRSKGPLGAKYPRYMFIMEGDTPSYLNLIGNGLDAAMHPDWGGWGGRYVWLQPYGETHPLWTQGGDEFARTTSQDAVVGVDGREHISDQATIWRWRSAFQNDFAARMDWTIHDFAHANHPPVVVVNGQSGQMPIFLDVQQGATVTLDASASHDPDRQKLHFHWFLYPEAGLTGGPGAAHGAEVVLSGADSPVAHAQAISACRPPWIAGLIPCRGAGVMHLIVAVTDDGSPALTAYRRVVLTVHPAQ